MRRVVVISDHVLLASLLGEALGREPDLHVLGVDGSVAGVADEPDVVVVESADSHRVVAMADEVRRRWPLAGVVMLADRSTGFDELTAAVRGSTAGLSVLSAAAVASARDRLRSTTARSAEVVYPPLTEREREVLRGLATGAGPALIARSLGISVNTCRGYLRTLMAKMGARSQREVLAFVAQHGLPDGGS